MPRYPLRSFRSVVLLALVSISTSLIAAETAVPPKPAVTSKPSGPAVRQVLVADAKLPRVLLIGDSILGGYHAKAAELLRGKVSLDVWITPKHIGSKDLPADMKAIFAEHTYDVILFNDIGLHAWTPGRIPGRPIRTPDARPPGQPPYVCPQGQAHLGVHDAHDDRRPSPSRSTPSSIP